MAQASSQAASSQQASPQLAVSQTTPPATPFESGMSTSRLVVEVPADLPEDATPQYWQGPAAQQSSATQPAPATEQNPTTQQTQKQLADEQLKVQEKQRILGIVPNFNTSYDANAVSLTAGQKYKLALVTMKDYVQFAVPAVLALYDQATDDPYAYGGGIGGYLKRYGATYADNFDSTMLGNAVFPALLHQDPRYFRLGYGSTRHRFLYALATNVITRHDNTGRWEPNYSNVLGNIAAGGLSNLYEPEEDRGVGETFSSALLVTAEGSIGSVFQEFWPDISRRLLHRDPTNGQDAVLRQKMADKKREKHSAR